MPNSDNARRTPASGRSPGPRWTAVLIFFFAALAAASAYLWNANRRLDRQLAALRDAAQDTHRSLDDARDALDLLSATDTVLVTLQPPPGGPQGIARVLYSARTGALMYDGWLASVPEAKMCELWLVPRQGSAISAGVFHTSRERADHWTAKLPAGTAAARFVVTLEPEGGSPQPTGPKILSGP